MPTEEFDYSFVSRIALKLVHVVSGKSRHASCSVIDPGTTSTIRMSSAFGTQSSYVAGTPRRIG
jgi:hypothetical protein